MLQQLRAIVFNSFRVTLGDPLFLIVHLTALLLLAVLGAIPGFTYGEHIRFLRDQSQALLFIAGCLTVTFGLIRALTDDIRRGAGAMVISRPVMPWTLILGRWLGVTASVAMIHLSLSLACLWMSEVAYNDEYLNMRSLTLYLVLIVTALVASAIRHYLLGGSFTLHANLLLTILLVIGFGVRVAAHGTGHFDWPSVQSSAMLFCGMITYSAFLLPIAVILDAGPVLGVGLTVFFFGLISEYIMSKALPPGLVSDLVKALAPNWQLYWIADRLGEARLAPSHYMRACAAQAVLFLTFYLVLATMVYEKMEIQGSETV